jgi:hypothetical protein
MQERIKEALTMVQFNEKSYTIEVNTSGNPVECWQELQSEIAFLFGIINQDNMRSDGFAHLAMLLDELRPPWEVARKMTDK